MINQPFDPPDIGKIIARRQKEYLSFAKLAELSVAGGICALHYHNKLP